MKRIVLALILAALVAPATPARAADDSKVKAATNQVETGAKKIGQGKVGDGVEETAKGIGKTVVEGAAAAAYAAVVGNRDLFQRKRVGIVLSGGNIDMRLLSNVILRELSREGRILSVVVEIEAVRGPGPERVPREGDRGRATLETCERRLQRIARGIAGAGVVIALVHARAVLHIGRGQVDRRHHCAGQRVRALAAFVRARNAVALGTAHDNK